MKKIEIIITNIVFYVSISLIIFFIGRLTASVEEPEECYFSGNAKTTEELNLYTRLDEIIRSRK